MYTQHVTENSNSTSSVLRLSREEQKFAQIVADLVEQWGFRRHLGRVWSLLYLRPDPLNPSQIKETLGLSSGNVNTVLHELLNWGVIKRVRIPSDRKHYYEVSDQIWKSVCNVMKAREMRILSEALSQMKTLQEQVGVGKSDKEKYQSEQIQRVENTLDVVYKVANAILATDPKHIEKITKLVTKLKLL